MRPLCCVLDGLLAGLVISAPAARRGDDGDRENGQRDGGEGEQEEGFRSVHSAPPSQKDPTLGSAG